MKPMKPQVLSVSLFGRFPDSYRDKLFAHTADGIIHRPVSAPIPNAKFYSISVLLL
ncbi:MAG: hypothetical protein H7098_13610 [Oligoflexus sp.]|nr:hypothetical protein [Pseudopedobacter sp.]